MTFHLLWAPVRESRATVEEVPSAGAGEPEGDCAWAAGKPLCRWLAARSLLRTPVTRSHHGYLMGPGCSGAAHPSIVCWSRLHLAASNDHRLSPGLAGAGLACGKTSPSWGSLQSVYTFYIRLC